MIDTNVKGLLWVSRAVLPGMVARDRGHVINIGSVAGHQVYQGGNVYCATKYAVRALTQGLRLDLLGTRVRCSTVDPGMVQTEFSEVRFHGDQERAAKVYRNFPPLQPADVAEAILFCATRPPARGGAGDPADAAGPGRRPCFAPAGRRRLIVHEASARPGTRTDPYRGLPG